MLQSAADHVTRVRRRWARTALLLAVLALVVLLVGADRRSVAMIALVAGATVVVVGGGFWFLEQRGPLRWLALALVAAVPLLVLVLFVLASLAWVALVVALLLAAAVDAARRALQPDPSTWTTPTTAAPPCRHAVLVMNPRSGGGKVGRFDLVARAEELGAQVALLDGGTDVTELARRAVADGADLLGAAGVDGTQALVARVAAEHDLPFLVVPAGTRNHFALDLGLDRADPSLSLQALSDGEEARIDLGDVNGRPFVNNVSFGAYAEIVENPSYRDDKRGTTLDALPELLRGQRGAHLVAAVGSNTLEQPQALLVSNGPYEAGDLAGLGRRAHLDGGVLGVIAVRVGSARQAVGCCAGRTTAASPACARARWWSSPTSRRSRRASTASRCC